MTNQLPLHGTLERVPTTSLRRVDLIPFGPQLSREVVLRARLAVHEMNRKLPTRRVANGREPAMQLAAIGVCAVPIEHLDPRAQRHVVAEDTKHRTALDD